MPAIIADRLVKPAERVADALADPRWGGRTALALIATYGLLWWAYAVVAKGSQSIHFDMGEIFAWSLEPAFGYPKHPPFSVWVVTAWFAVFPRTDWAYYLLSVTCVGVALWFVWLIAAEFVSGHKRAVALVLLGFTPGFNFLALKYNPNALLVPVWAGAAWLFLRSWRERTAWSGALAGLGAAIAMLSKYWSIFLIVGIGAAVLADRRRAAYFHSPAPYAAMAVGAAAIAPNIVSLLQNGFQPFTYATETHAAATFGPVFRKIVNYLGSVLYLAGPLAVLALASRPTSADWRDMVWPRDNGRRFIAVLQWSAFAAPVAVALAMRMQLDSLWTVSSWPLLPALLLSSPKVTITRRAAGAILVAAYAVACVALAAAPAVALFVLRQGVDNSQIYFAPLAREVDQLWPTVSDRPLRYVGGEPGLAWGCTFYCRDKPRAFPGFVPSESPWIDTVDMARRGFVGLCVPDNTDCLAEARKLADGNPHLREETVILSRTAFGIAAVPRRFTVVLAPPQP